MPTPPPEVEKVKSVSGNLRIGPKTFCENTGVLEWILFILKISGHSNYVEKCCFSRIVHNFLKKCLQASLACLQILECLVGVCNIFVMGARVSKCTQQLQAKKMFLNQKCGCKWWCPKYCFKTDYFLQYLRLSTESFANQVAEYLVGIKKISSKKKGCTRKHLY